VIHIRGCKSPLQALHHRYKDEGAYVDCYTTVVLGAISHPQFVEAFYTTWLFKLERWVLFLLLSKPSTDEQARQLANGDLNTFAAWSVEGRAENQLLMRDFQSKTRSWLMVAQEGGEGTAITRLYFGSVIIADIDKPSGKRKLSLAFKVLLPIHKLYARALLAAARYRLRCH
jgi:hypothetical protein